MRSERERLRQSFGQTAGLYDRVRPDYPDSLYDDLVAAAGLAPGDRLLEIGCATGKATRPLARRGFSITCVEFSAALATTARRNLAAYDVSVAEGQFEEFPADGQFALVYAAASWHWIDPAVRYRQAWQALRPGGHLAIWGQEHVFPDDGDPFFHQIQDVYDEIAEGLPDGHPRPRPGELTDDRAAIEASGLFEVVLVRQYDWERVYREDEYIDLLRTFSGPVIEQDWQRDRVFGEIRRRLADHPVGAVHRHWGSVLNVARRRHLSRGSACAVSD
jgi:SAM-dependent methyltransferase